MNLLQRIVRSGRVSAAGERQVVVIHLLKAGVVVAIPKTVHTRVSDAR